MKLTLNLRCYKICIYQTMFGRFIIYNNSQEIMSYITDLNRVLYDYTKCIKKSKTAVIFVLYRKP